jgi:hypothetical protein
MNPGPLAVIFQRSRTVTWRTVTVTGRCAALDGTLDAEQYAVCPDCKTRIHSGSVGLANLEKNHRAADVIFPYMEACLIT